MDTPNLPKQRPINPSQSPPPPAWWQDRLKLSLVIAVAVFAVIVTVLLLMFVNGPDGEGAVASATPSPSAPSSPSPSLPAPTSSVEPSSSVAPSPTSSAFAVPSDPPQAELAEGWARINTGLNLRDGAGENNPIVTKLQPGDVVWVSSGPYRENEADDEFDWYYVETLNDTYGWVASGAPDDPHAANLSNQFRFRSCGPVQPTANGGMVNGLRVGRFPDVERAAFELGQATATQGCAVFSFEDYEPTVRVELGVHACGAPSWDGSAARLSPTTAGSVDATWRVPSTVVVPGLLMTSSQQTDDGDGLSNHQKLFVLGSRTSSPFACFITDLVRGKSHKLMISTEITGCLALISKGTGTATFAPPGGESMLLLRQTRDHLAPMPFNDPSRIRLFAGGGNLGSEILGDC
jgi:hypothetical protein